MKIGNAMMQTPEGKKQFIGLVNSSVNFELKLHEGIHPKFPNRNGEMTPDNRSRVQGDFTKAEINIYKGAISNYFNNLKKYKKAIQEGKILKLKGNTHEDVYRAYLYGSMPSSIEELIGHVAIHEAEHGLNKNAQRKYNPSYKSREIIADIPRIKAINQMSDYRISKLKPIIHRLKIKSEMLEL